MWGTRLRMYVDLEKEKARREELTRRVDTQQTMIAFLSARINQLETERALLLRQLTSIDFPTPVLQVTPNATQTSDPREALEAIAGLGIFEDDPRHAPAGWHDDGRVNYGGLPVPTPGH
jgi:hypothetical protein